MSDFEEYNMGIYIASLKAEIEQTKKERDRAEAVIINAGSWPQTVAKLEEALSTTEEGDLQGVFEADGEETMSDIPKISDSSEFINDLVSATEDDVMSALTSAIKHRDSCTNDICRICSVFRKHEQKHREEKWGWGRKIRVTESFSLHFLLSGETREQRRFEHTLVLGARVLRIEKIAMTTSLRDSEKEDGSAVTISHWARGSEPAEPRLESQPASFFAPNPLGSGYLFARLKDGDMLGFTASFRDAATLSVDFYGRLGSR